MMNYLSNIIANTKKIFTNMDLDVKRILHTGLKLSFVLILISTYILYIYQSVNTQAAFNIGISLFKSGISFIFSFIIFSICFSKIKFEI